LKNFLTAFYTAAFLILAFAPGLSAQSVATLQDAGPGPLRVDLAILGDGYTSSELGKFATDADRFVSGMFAEEPFKEYRSYFNVRRIDVASNESGVDHPERGVAKDTAFDAYYNCAGIQRLVCLSTGKVLAAAAVLSPNQRDLIIVIVNDSEYGGAGGPVAVGSTHSLSTDIILHEIGHTFAGLADEYTSQPPVCSDTIEPSDANATKVTNRAELKWAAWVETTTPLPTTATTNGVPGAYLGSRYCPATLYRPTFNSKMRSSGRPYEQINTEQFVKRFYEFALPIESRTPQVSSLSLRQGDRQQFSVTSPQPTTHTITVTWHVDGTTVASGTSFLLLASTLTVGTHTLTANAADSTVMVRSDPLGLLRGEARWTLQVSADGPSDVTPPLLSAITASGISISGATIAWTTDESSDTQVEYGLTTAYGSSTTLVSAMATSHSASLTGLASNTTYHYRVRSRDAAGNLTTGSDNTFRTPFSISNLGGVSRISTGTEAFAYGYGRIASTSGTTPSGLAVLGLRQGGILVNEAGVTAQPLLSSALVYAEVSADGLLNTGVAIANPNPSDISLTFTIRDTNGNVVKSDTVPIAANSQLVGFLNGYPFFSGNGVQGSLSFTASLPVAVIALRGYFNERSPSEFLMTTLPVVNLAAPVPAATQVIPHFAAGAGWSTYLLLLNPTGVAQTGSVQVLDGNGAPQVVIIDGVTASSASYTVNPNTSRKISISGAGGLVFGPIRVIPAGGGAAPVPLVVFSFKDGPITVSEAGVPVTMGTAFRLFAQQSPVSQISAGIAIANGTSVEGRVTLSLTNLSGSVLASREWLLPASGQIVGFLDSLLPTTAGQNLEGILRITTDLSSIAVVGLRGRINERGHFLMTTTAPTLEGDASTTAERLFPHLVDGGGWTTQFILFSGTAGQTSGGTLNFVTTGGVLWGLNIN
jgi:hypothetical protein